MIDGFEDRRVEGAGAEIALSIGGSGPPLLLLHGHPQTRAMWARVARRLAGRFTLVAADLRGYGASSKPASAPDHAPYSKRAMAADMAAVMTRLGFDRFAVAGHDRGGRVAHRLCLDHGARIDRAAVLDIAPTRHMYRATDMSFATGYWHWFFLIQPHPLPETVIGADPETFWKATCRTGPAGLSLFEPAALADYLAAYRRPGTIHAICEDYRAAATIDLEHDDADFAAGRRIEAPLLVLWGARGKIGEWYDPLAVWRDYARDVAGAPVEAGHFLAEERPEEVARLLAAFFGG